MPPLFNQRDPQWAGHRINNTASTLGQYGCTVTSLALLFFGELGKNPQQMEEYLRERGAFINDLVFWVNIPYFRRRFYCESTLAPVDEIKAELATRPVLIAVHMGPGNPYKTNHWVLAIDQDFTILDPWTGDKVNIRDRYGAPEKAILGGAYFDIPTPVWPSEYPKEGTITAAVGVNVRSLPTLSASVYRKLAKGKKVTLIGDITGDAINGNNKWYDTGDGYIHSAFVS